MYRNRHVPLALAVASLCVVASTAHAQKLVISEVLSNEVNNTYNGEWIEIYNGTDLTIDLSNYKIGDEETFNGTGTTEAMFQFPEGASIAPGEVQVIAGFAARFVELYGFRPNYEAGAPASEGWVDDGLVANMRAYTAWDADGDRLNMNNTNDQVAFLDPSDAYHDGVSWGGSTFFMSPSAPNGGDGQGQARYDVTVDTDTAADWYVVDAAPAGAFWTSRSTPGTVNISNWTTDADGNWSDFLNWSAAGEANRASWIANFGPTATAPRTITIDTAKTVGVLNLDNTNGYTLAGTETLTLARAQGARIDVRSGSHTIATSLAFTNNTTLRVAADATLTLTGTMSGGTAALTKSEAGTLAVRHLRAGSLTIEAGRVEVIAGNADESVSLLQAMSIADGAELDLNDNALVIDYTATGVSPLAEVTSLITANKLVSSLALSQSRYGIGIIESALVADGTFRGQSLPAQALAIDLALKGDTNLDGSVSFGDLLSLAQNYDANGSGKTWAHGDSDYDGAVGFSDLLALAQNYGGSGLVGTSLDGTSFAQDWALAQSLVPEPAAVTLMLAGLVPLRRRR